MKNESIYTCHNIQYQHKNEWKDEFCVQLVNIKTFFSSGSNEVSYMHPMGDKEYDITKDFFTGNFNIPVADRTLLQQNGM